MTGAVDDFRKRIVRRGYQLPRAVLLHEISAVSVIQSRGPPDLAVQLGLTLESRTDDFLVRAWSAPTPKTLRTIRTSYPEFRRLASYLGEMQHEEFPHFLSDITWGHLRYGFGLHVESRIDRRFLPNKPDHSPYAPEGPWLLHATPPGEYSLRATWELRRADLVPRERRERRPGDEELAHDELGCAVNRALHHGIAPDGSTIAVQYARRPSAPEGRKSVS